MALCNDEYKNLCKGPDKGLRPKYNVIGDKCNVMGGVVFIVKCIQ